MTSFVIQQPAPVMDSRVSDQWGSGICDCCEDVSQCKCVCVCVCVRLFVSMCVCVCVCVCGRVWKVCGTYMNKAM